MAEKSDLTLIRVRQGCFIQRYLLPAFCLQHRLVLLTAPTKKDWEGQKNTTMNRPMNMMRAKHK